MQRIKLANAIRAGVSTVLYQRRFGVGLVGFSGAHIWPCIWLGAVMLALSAAACARISPTPALVTAGSAALRTAPAADSPLLDTLQKGDVLILRASGPSARWHAVKVGQHQTAWIEAAAVKTLFFESNENWLTAAVERSFGTTPAKAQLLFGPPRQVSQRTVAEPEMNSTQDVLFFSGHRATYTNGRLTGVQLEPFSTQRLGPWRLGQDAALLDGLDTLGKCEEFKGGRTFTVEPEVVVTFYIRQGKIVGLAFSKNFLGQSHPENEYLSEQKHLPEHRR